MNQSTIKKEKEAVSLAMAILGKRGGSKSTKKKRDASKLTLAKARDARWPNKK